MNPYTGRMGLEPMLGSTQKLNEETLFPGEDENNPLIKTLTNTTKRVNFEP